MPLCVCYSSLFAFFFLVAFSRVWGWERWINFPHCAYERSGRKKEFLHFLKGKIGEKFSSSFQFGWKKRKSFRSKISTEREKSEIRFDWKSSRAFSSFKCEGLKLYKFLFCGITKWGKSEGRSLLYHASSTSCLSTFRGAQHFLRETKQFFLLESIFNDSQKERNRKKNQMNWKLQSIIPIHWNEHSIVVIYLQH